MNGASRLDAPEFKQSEALRYIDSPCFDECTSHSAQLGLASNGGAILGQVCKFGTEPASKNLGKYVHQVSYNAI